MEAPTSLFRKGKGFALAGTGDAVETLSRDKTTEVHRKKEGRKPFFFLPFYKFRGYDREADAEQNQFQLSTERPPLSFVRHFLFSFSC
jgi:hypothetical protein